MWWYGAIKHRKKGEEWWSVHEIFDGKGTGSKSLSWANSFACGDTLEELVEDLENMLSDIKKGFVYKEKNGKLEKIDV